MQNFWGGIVYAKQSKQSMQLQLPSNSKKGNIIKFTGDQKQLIGLESTSMK